MKIRKLDEDQQIVFGEVYMPNVPDSQGDFMSPETIQQMAYDFLEKKITKIDENHDNQLRDAVPVESFIVRKGDPDFPVPGSWVVGLHVRDPELWDKIKKGEINGYSIEGRTLAEMKEIELEVPEYVVGKTDSVEGHSHEFKVFFDEDGNFLGGRTNTVGGHYHEIRKGTATDGADGHRHRFSFVEVLLNETES